MIIHTFWTRPCPSVAVQQQDQQPVWTHFAQQWEGRSSLEHTVTKHGLWSQCKNDQRSNNDFRSHQCKNDI